MPRRIGCGERDHLTRSNQPGWQEYVAIRNDLPGTVVDPVIPEDGYLCEPCAVVYNIRRATDIAEKQAQLDASRVRFRALGFTDDEIDGFLPRQASSVALIASAQARGIDDPSVLFTAANAAAAASRGKKT